MKSMHVRLFCLFILCFSFCYAQESRIQKKLRLAAEYKTAAKHILPKYASAQSVTYTVDSVLYAPYPDTGIAVLNGSDDIWTSRIAIGFPFCYYGVTYDTLLIGGNGEVTFDLSKAGGYDGWQVTSPLPNTTDLPAATICPAFRDIDASQGGNIFFQTVGTSPNRVLTISWVNIPLYNVSTACTGSSKSTFQVALYEGSGVIEMYIQNSTSCAGWNGGYGIIGIQDQAATVATCPPNRNYPNTWNAVNEAWQFVPSTSVCYSACGAVRDSICFVSSDSTPQNHIFFNHPPGAGIVGTIIYRLNGSGNWDSIGYVPATQPDEFLDLTANPNQQNYTYCISTTDSCGNYSLKSPPHTTVFLQTSLGMNGAINLSWNAYVGIPVSSYYIYRGTGPSSMSLIAQVPGNTLAYTDLNPPAGTNYYQVSFMGPPNCTSSAPHDTLVSSNYKVNTSVGMVSLSKENMCSIYPNPSHGQITIGSDNSIEEVKITDVLGKVFFEGAPKQKQVRLNLDVKGLYFVEVRTINGSTIRKLIVQ